MAIETLILLMVLAFILYKYVTRNFDHWEKKKVTYIEPTPFFGNILDLVFFRKTIGEHFANLYRQTDKPFFGIFAFGTPLLVLRSPELIKSVLVRDFNNFDDRNIASPAHDSLTSNLLFVNKNPEWKVVRTKISPVFTSGKLKAMMPLVNNVGETLKSYIEKKIPNISLDAKEICAKYSTDVIAKCAFGINAHCFDSDGDSDFRKMGRKVFDFRWKTAMQQSSYFFSPSLVDWLRLNFLDPEVSEYLKTAFWTTIEQREKSGQKINDLIDAIIEMKRNDKIKKEINFEGEKVVAQAVQFFLAGFETTSSTMAFTLYELSLHPHIQNKLRNEIKTCLDQHGGFTNEAIQNMKYLTMCISETLRKYPVLPFLDRKCKSDYKIPGTDIVIDKGTPVFIPLFGLHYDEEYFPNPQKYNPERFSEDNINQIVPFSYLPFGEGPRNCVGARFGWLSTKLGLIHILSEFEVEKSPDTPDPLVFEPKSFVLATNIGLPMKFRKVLSNAA